MSTWYTTTTPDELERVVQAWGDTEAPEENLETFEMILDVAKVQVLTFAPAPPPGDDGDPENWNTDPPGRLVYAQLQQAKNLWNAGRATPDVGPDGYSFTPRPLDKTIKTIIRPIDGKPDVL